MPLPTAFKVSVTDCRQLASCGVTDTISPYIERGWLSVAAGRSVGAAMWEAPLFLKILRRWFSDNDPFTLVAFVVVSSFDF